MLLSHCFVAFLCLVFCFLFFKHKTAYGIRISDWSSDVCSSDLTLVTSPVTIFDSSSPSCRFCASIARGLASSYAARSFFQTDACQPCLISTAFLAASAYWLSWPLICALMEVPRSLSQSGHFSSSAQAPAVTTAWAAS